MQKLQSKKKRRIEKVNNEIDNLNNKLQNYFPCIHIIECCLNETLYH